MNLFRTLSLILLTALGSQLANAQKSTAPEYTYFLRQVQMPDELEWDVSVAQHGTQQSPLPINPFGARFELWTILSEPLTSYLLDTTYVNSYIPVAKVTITSEDPYEVIPRTRCDRPFTVTIDVSGLSSDPAAPAAARSVKLLRHVQAYPGSSTGKGINRGQATLLSQGSLNTNGTNTLNYAVTSIPGGDRSKVRGEERFSVFSLADFQAPESQLDSQFIQIWPVATSYIAGISDGDVIKGAAPWVGCALLDLYPDSWTYAQVYKGKPVLGTKGEIVPGSSVFVDSAVPETKKLRLRNWDASIKEDGIWTLEILTSTPFGLDRLAYVNFEVERNIHVNGNVTSLE